MQRHKIVPPLSAYAHYELLGQLRAYKVSAAEDVPPHKFETGTKNHEGLAGTAAAINYLADIWGVYVLEEELPSIDPGILASGSQDLPAYDLPNPTVCGFEVFFG